MKIGKNQQLVLDALKQGIPSECSDLMAATGLTKQQVNSAYAGLWSRKLIPTATTTNQELATTEMLQGYEQGKKDAVLLIEGYGRLKHILAKDDDLSFECIEELQFHLFDDDEEEEGEVKATKMFNNMLANGTEACLNTLSEMPVKESLEYLTPEVLVEFSGKLLDGVRDQGFEFMLHPNNMVTSLFGAKVAVEMKPLYQAKTQMKIESGELKAIDAILGDLSDAHNIALLSEFDSTNGLGALVVDQVAHVEDMPLLLSTKSDNLPVITAMEVLADMDEDPVEKSVDWPVEEPVEESVEEEEELEELVVEVEEVVIDFNPFADDVWTADLNKQTKKGKKQKQVKKQKVKQKEEESVVLSATATATDFDPYGPCPFF